MLVIARDLLLKSGDRLTKSCSYIRSRNRDRKPPEYVVLYALSATRTRHALNRMVTKWWVADQQVAVVSRQRLPSVLSRK